MKTSIIYFTALTLVLVSCKGGSEDATNQENEETTSSTCTYIYDPTSTVLDWTAYKTTEKVPVKGTFNTLTVSETNSSEDPLKILQGAIFEIPVSTVNSQNPERDKKIAEHFFGAMANTPLISGEVKSFDNGTAFLNIKLNNIVRELKGNYVIDNNGVFTLDATLDLNNFNGKKAIASLNKICGILHAGADSISKLWADVDLHFETSFKKECK
jgi:hypothetical protein